MDIEVLFDFFSTMVPEIGILPTIIITLFIVAIFILIVVFMKIVEKKDKLVEKVIEEQSIESEKSKEFMKIAISEIKELSIMSTTELRGNTKKLESLVDLINLFIAQGIISKDAINKTMNPDQDLPKNGGDGS